MIKQREEHRSLLSVPSRPSAVVPRGAEQSMFSTRIEDGDQQFLCFSPHLVPRLHDRLDLHDLALLKRLEDGPVLVGRAVRVLVFFSVRLKSTRYNVGAGR